MGEPRAGSGRGGDGARPAAGGPDSGGRGRPGCHGGRRHRRAVAEHELGRQRDGPRDRPRLGPEAGHELLHGQPADLLERLADGRQRRRELRRLRAFRRSPRRRAAPGSGSRARWRRAGRRGPSGRSRRTGRPPWGPRPGSARTRLRRWRTSSRQPPSARAPGQPRPARPASRRVGRAPRATPADRPGARCASGPATGGARSRPGRPPRCRCRSSCNRSLGSALRKTTGGAEGGSCSWRWRMLAPIWGGAKMIPSTRWATKNSTTGTMSGRSKLPSSLRMIE